MKIAYLGPAGSHTEEAAATASATLTTAGAATVDRAAAGAAPDTELFACTSIAAVFEALATVDGVHYGVVPMENVIEGPVTETLDNLYRYSDRVKILDMFVLPIEHALGALPGHAVLRQVLSKDQALKQCSDFLAQWHPPLEPIETPSTSAAINYIAEQQRLDCAAIGSAATLRRLGLEVMARDIGNVKRNKTRFALLSRTQAATRPPTGRDATQIVIYPHRDRIGLLHDILGVLSREHGLNCLAIHSRPDTHGAFRFFVELEGHLHQPAVQAALAALHARLEGTEVEVRVFGSYSQCRFAQARLRTIGIIGGTGQMGQWFKGFFTAAGYEVLIAGRRTVLTPEACVQQCEALLINVPISHTEATIERLGPLLAPGQLIVDNTSIKSQPVEAMLRAVPEGVEVLGMHTVFGPSVAHPRGQNVIFTRTSKSHDVAREFEDIFHKHGAHVTYTTPEQHDEQMAFHQNLEHFSKLVLAEVARRTFADPRELAAFSSPNSRASLATMQRILQADPLLCAEIQTLNRAGLKLIRQYLEVAQELAAALEEHRMEYFHHIMQQGLKFFGSASAAPLDKNGN